MQTNSLLKKGLLCGIIVLLVGMSMIPMVIGLPIKRHASIASSTKETGPRDRDWTVSGTMGNNNWYISPVTMSCFFEGDVFYQYGNYGWKLYDGPFTICTQGSIFFQCYVVYWDGTKTPIGNTTFKIDYTPPLTEMSVKKFGFTKWRFSALAYDNISGVEKVEFYLDAQLLGNVPAPGPYVWVWTGSGRHTVTAIAYDFAGNTASSSVSTPCIQGQSQSSPSVQQKTILFQHLIYNLILRHQIMVK